MSDTIPSSDVPDDGRRYVHYDPESEQRMSTTLALAVADLEGVEPTALDPLAYATDPETLDSLVAENTDGAVSGDVSFEFAGYDVTVHPCGYAELVPREDANA